MNLDRMAIVNGVPVSFDSPVEPERIDDLRRMEIRDEGVRGDTEPAPVVKPVQIPAPAPAVTQLTRARVLADARAARVAIGERLQARKAARNG